MYNPLVSILICSRDRQEQLTNCLRSLSNLNYEPFEVIVIDNASREFEIPKVPYPRRTRFYSQPVPGLSYARNLAVRHAAGEIVAFIDDDAIPHPDWLRAAVCHFQSSSIGCVTGKVEPLELENEWQRKFAEIPWHPTSTESKLYDDKNFHPLVSMPGIGCNFLVRRSFFNGHEFSSVFNVGTPVNGKDECYLFYELIQSGYQIFYEPRAIVYHDYGSTEQQFKKKFSTYLISHAAFLTHFLFKEKGQRFFTLRYLISKLITTQDKNGDMRIPLVLKLKARMLGPLVLWKSNRLAERNRFKLSEEGIFLKEFRSDSVPNENLSRFR